MRKRKNALINILEKMKLQAGSLLEEYKGRQKGEKVNTVFEDVTRGQWWVASWLVGEKLDFTSTHER